MLFDANACLTMAFLSVVFPLMNIGGDFLFSIPSVFHY